MPSPHAEDDKRYRALCSHDARFDGHFFVGVTTTGIYCRPVCRVRTPRQENCRFFDQATQAEQAGFRPCLRCRPELAPLQRHWSATDAAGILVRQATRWLDDPAHGLAPAPVGGRIRPLALRLGVGERHLRRLFEARLGVSPLQALLTRQLLTAKQLLTDTPLPITEVALASGFSSLRRFHAAFQSRYGLNPPQLRRGLSTSAAPKQAQPHSVKLAWRPPLDAAALLGFMAQRQLPGLERIDPLALTLQRGVRLRLDGRTHTGWLAVQFDTVTHRLLLQVSDSLQAVLPSVIWRVRAMFDLDADPSAINAVLHADFPTGDGLRVPGVFDGFELAVRAVLGQKITVAAARTLALRLCEHWGEPLHTPHSGLDRLFPSAEVLAAVDASGLGELGIVRQRQQAIQALARAVASGALDLDDQTDPEKTREQLVLLPGIGPWTAQYIAMRALRWPDAWLSGDVAVHHALGLDHRLGAATRREAARLAAAWQPWRSYATVRAWAGCYQAQDPVNDMAT
jgi:AraC family transcriptional regulator of adaptative response / DNA-3-methyladenine glycosylase II